MRNKRATALATLLVILGAGAGSVLGSIDLSDEALGVLLDMKTINEVLMFTSKEEDDFEHPAKWMTLRSFAKSLPEPYRERLPMKDPWGGPYHVLSHENEMVVVSAGPDGLNDVRDVLESFPSFEPQREAKKLMRECDDIILVVGRDIVKGPVSRAELQRETMSRMRVIASEIERSSTQSQRYPARGLELVTLATVAPDLPSGRTGELPLEDAWGYPLLYWSDTNAFMLVSTGADAVLDRDHSLAARGVGEVQFLGEFTGEDQDIVYTGGQFAQWPKIHKHH